MIQQTWNSEAWRRKFEEASCKGDRRALRQLRIGAYHDTIQHVMNGEYDLPNGETITIEGDKEMVRGTKFYDRKLTVKAPELTEPTRIEVINGDTLQVAKRLLDDGLRPAVLNMASGSNPGGGVLNGSGAQEENLFRRTNLFRSLCQFAPYAEEYDLPKSPHQYPLDRSFGGIYTPQAYVFRGTEQDGYPLLEHPYCLDFIAVPAVNRPELTADDLIAPRFVEITKRKMRTILNIALAGGNDSLVLGAMGCGAFCNPPAHVARLFREVFDEPLLRNRFRRIAFAILNDHNTGRAHNPQGNFLPFVREFGEALGG